MKTLILTAMILTAAAHAGRTSVDYAITAEALDFGGQPVASANYTIDGSIGAVAGISGEATSAIVAKHGYSGQLYDLLAVMVAVVRARLKHIACPALAGLGRRDIAQARGVQHQSLAVVIVFFITGCCPGPLAASAVPCPQAQLRPVTA